MEKTTRFPVAVAAAIATVSAVSTYRPAERLFGVLGPDDMAKQATRNQQLACDMVGRSLPLKESVPDVACCADAGTSRAFQDDHALPDPVGRVRWADELDAAVCSARNDDDSRLWQ